MHKPKIGHVLLWLVTAALLYGMSIAVINTNETRPLHLVVFPFLFIAAFFATAKAASTIVDWKAGK